MVGLLLVNTDMGRVFAVKMSHFRSPLNIKKLLVFMTKAVQVLLTLYLRSTVVKVSSIAVTEIKQFHISSGWSVSLCTFKRPP